jgi:hypothetical protein
MILEVTCYLGGIKFRMCPLITLQAFLHLAGQNYRPSANAKNKFFVLIENVEVVDQPKGIVRRIGSIVRLKSFDETPDFTVCDSLYLSFIKSALVRIVGPLVKNRKLNLPRGLYRAYREMPNNVIETGSQVVNDLAG